MQHVLEKRKEFNTAAQSSVSPITQHTLHM